MERPFLHGLALPLEPRLKFVFNNYSVTHVDPNNDPLGMAVNHVGEFYGFNLGVQDIPAPLLKSGMHGVDPFALKDCSQLFSR